ncbi:hypothetical protein [Rhodovastum atsumiense]|uniref:Uncharacterized protein n=1 Tax=Rhodovastum atsumiense TaxID=504468 RepID=A0A5M6IJZ8_9PROT|nr:hypothetical protein [Rhodovastum atsumiense]KAA5608593.1 hypothetical protein F1189_28390 [Rhodovastum atsumiense]
MFVPPLGVLLEASGKTAANWESEKQISIPTGLFKFLVQLAIATSDFNERDYLKENPDVNDAIKMGDIESAKLHYAGYGYFEGRMGALPDVDEAWYLKVYPDVAEAVRKRQISSGAEHFRVVGVKEGRSPSAAYDSAAAKWKAALRSMNA